MQDEEQHSRKSAEESIGGFVSGWSDEKLIKTVVLLNVAASVVPLDRFW